MARRFEFDLWISDSAVDEEELLEEFLAMKRRNQMIDKLNKGEISLEDFDDFLADEGIDAEEFYPNLDEQSSLPVWQ
jgi:predicted HTH domain antitoxin